MNRIYLILTLFLSGFVFSQTQKIAMDGSFGGTRCNGSVGLCSTKQSSGAKSAADAKMYAEKIDDKSFRLVVNRSKIGAEEELRITGNKLSAQKTFSVEEDFLLDEQTARAIGLQSGFTVIPKGIYPLTFDNEKVVITFQVAAVGK